MTDSPRSGPATPERGSGLGSALRLVIGTFFAAVLIVIGAQPASAHVNLVSSVPANISAVQGPVNEIRFTFSGAADPVDDQFRIEDAQGSSVAIESVENDGADTVVVSPASTLPVGRNKVTWALRGADGHSMNGAIAFTVAASASTATTVKPVAETPPGSTAPTELSTGIVSIADEQALAVDATPASNSRDSSREIADNVATFARWIVYAALLFCVGGLGYLSWVHRGSVAEGRMLVFYTRRAALIVFLAAILGWFAQLVVFDFGNLTGLVSPSVWSDLLNSGFAIGTLFRLVGAGLVLAFLKIDLDSRPPSVDPSHLDMSWLDEVPAAGSSSVDVRAEPVVGPTRLRMEASPLAFLGAFILVASESFIGHTASVEPRVLVLLSDAVHMVAAGLWAAGSFMLVATLWRRHRRGVPLDARLLATRFSVMAGWSLALVAVTGLALAWSILGSISALWQTGFGRLLVAKVAVVAVVAAIGGYNHRVLVPALSDGDASAAGRFRRVITIEAALFAVILLLTAFLVVANPN